MGREHQVDNDRVLNDMQMVQSDLKKWQEKHNMAVKDMQIKDQALQRVEVELERTRHEWERAKIAVDKAEGSQKIQDSHLEKLQKEIEEWRGKHNKAINDVDEA